MELEHKEISEQIIGASFEVYRELGYGFLERVYLRAMKVELELRGLTAEIETEIEVRYKGHLVGDYRADILVNGCILVELKVSPMIDYRDEAQLLNELKATGIKVGLLINFGKKKTEFKRLVFLTFFRAPSVSFRGQRICEQRMPKAPPHCGPGNLECMKTEKSLATE